MEINCLFLMENESEIKMRSLFSVVVFIFCCVAPVVAQRGDWYNDEGGFKFEGSGTETDPYRISSVTALAFLAEQVNMWPGKSFHGEYFVLTDDLDLGLHYWIPIGSEAHQPFRGLFDGNGKSIRNLFIGSTEVDNVYAAAGLFGYLGNGAKVENLTLEGGIIIGGGREDVSRTGALAGYLLCSVSEEKDSIVVRNCHIRGMQIAGGSTQTTHTGGLAGEAYAFADGGGEALIRIEYATNHSAISAPDSSAYPYTGGLLGKGHGQGYSNEQTPASGRVVLNRCLNAGNIRGGAAAGKDAVSSTGGILGYGYGSASADGSGDALGALLLEYCLNRGRILGGDALAYQSLSWAGGLSGYADGSGYGYRLAPVPSEAGSGSGRFTVHASANLGEVQGGEGRNANSVVAVGGILGYASASAWADSLAGNAGYGLLAIRNCYSHAPLVAPSGSLGGLAGHLASTGRGENHRISVRILNSYVAGSLEAKDTLQPAAAGGIVGRVQKSKEARRAPQVGNCVARLTRLNGPPGRTFRIVGALQGVARPLTAALSRNYARVETGEWVKIRSIKNGHAWSESPLALPLSEWNINEKVWQIKTEDGLPKLLHLPGQNPAPAEEEKPQAGAHQRQSQKAVEDPRPVSPEPTHVDGGPAATEKPFRIEHGGKKRNAPAYHKKG
jgi:hypothetical protein